MFWLVMIPIVEAVTYWAMVDKADASIRRFHNRK